MRISTLRVSLFAHSRMVSYKSCEDKAMVELKQVSSDCVPKRESAGFRVREKESKGLSQIAEA